MYISLGLLWLSFKTIQGEIIQCPIGGLTDTEQCEKLTQESVFQRFFIYKENTSPTHKIFATLCLEYLLQLNNGIANRRLNDFFLQAENSLILDEKIPIKERWDDALKIGTDTYRIKFHTKLIDKYKHIDKSLPNEEWMVLIQSFYAAASTYYFSKKCDFAYNVINEGLTFFGIVTKDNQEKHTKVWSIVLQTLKVDILKCLNKFHDEKAEVMNKISEEEKIFDCPNYGSFPSSAVLLFRGYFLDKDIDNNTKTKLENWLNNHKLWGCLNDDILDRDYISSYKFLILYYNCPKDIDKIINIYKAIEKPVLSTEDKLLNYKATELALVVVSSCFDGKKSPICNEFSKLKNINPQLESRITPKLRILYDLKTKNLINELKTILSINNQIIQQNVLHLIVTAALDIDSEKYQKNIKNVKLAIELLDKFVSDLKNEKSTQHKITEENRIKNLFIVYKWLIEMNGILSNDPQATTYQNKFEEALKNATDLSMNILYSSYGFKSDDHFKYLKLKKKIKTLLPPYSWEVSTRPGSWIPKSFKKTAFKIMKVLIFGNEISSQLGCILSCEYINIIELQTLTFRSKRPSGNFNEMYRFIIKAITEIVITPEDRLKNLEAHELLTVFLMERNKLAIDSMKKYKNDISAIYKDLLMDPELRDKKIPMIKSQEQQDLDNYWTKIHNRNNK